MSIFLGFLLFLALGGLVYLGVQLVLTHRAKVKLEDELRREQEQRSAEVGRLNKALAAPQQGR